jgi:hypothetical protein
MDAKTRAIFRQAMRESGARSAASARWGHDARGADRAGEEGVRGGGEEGHGRAAGEEARC